MSNIVDSQTISERIAKRTGIPIKTKVVYPVTDNIFFWSGRSKPEPEVVDSSYDKLGTDNSYDRFA